MLPRPLVASFVLALLVCGGVPEAYGQVEIPLGAPSGGHIQAGVGLLPGFGAQIGYTGARSFYTREVTAFVDITPTFAGGEGSAEVAAGLGGAVRILGIWRTLGNAPYRGYDIDVGLRLVPGVDFAFNESREAKNQRFNLTPDLFVRMVFRLKSNRLLFAEIGVERPKLRAGFWFPL